MKIFWIPLIALLLASCSDSSESTFDAPTLALRELRESRDNESFLIITDKTDVRHYIQFMVMEDKIFFDRPILTAHQINLPEVGPRFYKAVESVPIIENVEKFRSLTLDELDKVKLYLEKWNLASDTIFTATENEDGMIVGYVESFHGFFSVPDSKFPDFLNGFFSEVFNVAPESQNLLIENENT